MGRRDCGSVADGLRGVLVGVGGVWAVMRSVNL
jgi:hypothetical protein